jgi:hypothetical protein
MRHSFLNTLAGALLAIGVACGTAVLGAPVHAQEAVRPEVGKPLQAASDLIRAKRFKEALAKVRDADAVANKTPNEHDIIERMRLAAASGAGDADTAARSFEAVGARMSAADRLRVIESLTGMHYRARSYGKAVQWGQRYFKEGGTSTAMRTLLIQSQYLSGDFAGAARELTTEITQAEKAGDAPGEDRLKLLVNATLKMKDTNGYVWALERLVTYYPKKDYWVDLLGRLQRKPHFSDRLALDIDRLSLASGSMSTANDYMEMAQLALQAGMPAEARQVLDQGFAVKVLGQGAQAARQQRLRDLVLERLAEAKRSRTQALAEAQSAKDGTALVDLGMNMVYEGDKQGLALMLQGIARGHMKHENDARLHLAIAQIAAGETSKAQATLRGVGGTDGTADLARLWGLFAKRR